MAKRKKPAASNSMTPLAIPPQAEWVKFLRSFRWETVQIVPANRTVARFKEEKDEEIDYQVVVWALQARTLDDEEKLDYCDDEIPPSFITRIVGAIVEAGGTCLVELEGEEDGFVGYFTE